MDIYTSFVPERTKLKSGTQSQRKELEIKRTMEVNFADMEVKIEHGRGLIHDFAKQIPLFDSTILSIEILFLTEAINLSANVIPIVETL